MKALLVLLGLALIFAGFVTWYSSRKLEQVPDEYLAMAFGEPTNDRIQMDVAVSIGMARRDPPQPDPTKGPINWDQWVTEHFSLRDASGAELSFTRGSMSRLMTDQEVGGSPEFFLSCKLVPNKQYTFIYRPYLTYVETFRYEFTAPAAEVPMERARFRLVEKPVP
jgi:hypothetical protein